MTEDHDRQNCLCDACVTWRFNRSQAGQSGQTSGRRSRGGGRQSGPPIAKNPANQEYINEMWRQDQERKAAERRERRAAAGRLAKGVASAAIAVYGAHGQSAQDSGNTQHRWSESQGRSEGRRRGDAASDVTRDKGSHDRESGQQ